MGGAADAVGWLLAKGGIDMTAKNKEGHTPLDKARLKCKPEVVALLENAIATVDGMPASPSPDDAAGGGHEAAAVAALPTIDEAGGGVVVAAAAAPAGGNAAPGDTREPPPPFSKRQRLG